MLINLSLSTLLDKKLGEEKEIFWLKKKKKKKKLKKIKNKKKVKI